MRNTRTVASLLAALALHAAALAQPAAPAPKPVAPAVTEANASTAGPAKASPAATPGAPAQPGTPGQPQAKPGEAAPGAQSGVQGAVQGEAPKGARPPSGKPPVVVGPDGRAHASSASASNTRVAMPGSRSAGNVFKPASRSIRVGVANGASTTDGASENATTAVASIPLTSRIALASVTPTSESQSVHTWTRSGTTLAADATSSSGAGTAAGSVGNAISAGLLASSSVTNSNASAKGGIPAGIVNDMLVRIGGMATQMAKQSTTASAAE